MNAAWWALGVSALSLLIAAGSLAWNIHSFSRTGPIIEVKLSTSTKMRIVQGAPEAKYSWQTGSRNGRSFLKSIYLDVVVYNEGRSPVDLAELWIMARGVDLWSGTSVLSSDELPVRIEHGSMRSYEVDLVEYVDDLADDEERAEFFIAEAKLGNGKTVRSNPIPLSAWSKLLRTAEDFSAQFPSEASAKKDENIQ